MRALLVVSLFLFSLLGSLRAEAEANYWLWYPRTPPGQPYGNNVIMGSDGQWMSQGGQMRWSRFGTPSSGVISPENSNRRNGELAYRAAYLSFREGQRSKKNKIEPLVGRGRWTKKITTWNEIVLYKDNAGNVAVETPDGKWHVTDRQGDYAYTKIELPTEVDAFEKKEMVAEAKPSTNVKKKTGRSLASMGKPVYADPKEEKNVIAKPSSDPVFDNPLLPK